MKSKKRTLLLRMPYTQWNMGRGESKSSKGAPKRRKQSVGESLLSTRGETPQWYSLKGKRFFTLRQLAPYMPSGEKYAAWCSTPGAYQRDAQAYVGTGNTPEEALWHAFQASTAKKNSQSLRKTLGVESANDMKSLLEADKPKEYEGRAFYINLDALLPPAKGKLWVKAFKESEHRTEGEWDDSDPYHSTHDFTTEHHEFTSFSDTPKKASYSDEYVFFETSSFVDPKDVAKAGGAYVVVGFADDHGPYDTSENLPQVKGVFLDQSHAKALADELNDLEGIQPWRRGCASMKRVSVYHISYDPKGSAQPMRQGVVSPERGITHEAGYSW